MIEAVTLSRLANDLRRAMSANPNATFSEVVEALALIASENAGDCVPDSVNQQSWDNACGHLFDLAQAGRLYRNLTKET